ncbi:MAG: alcohol dehydrogenase catalytic domain-containing protein [Desulfobacterales bacterium]|nr:alcohol dehydrogenase catalytic domain-containing protein [Desulfobacterales bacterium]
MKCMVLEEFNASLVLRERDRPTPGPGETILRVGAAGACRTDLKIWHGNHPAAGKLPLVPGHEIAGEVVEVGKGVDKDIKGRHAVVFAYLSCGECSFCKTGHEPLCTHLKGQIGFNLDGGFAEYVKVPLNSLFFIRPDIPFEQAAILADAVATPYRALTSKIKIQPGETLAVIGAGGLGIHAVQIARAFGARVLAIDINGKALAMARVMGAEKTLLVTQEDPTEEMRDLSEGKGVDAVIEFVGKPEMQRAALHMLKVAGRFAAVGYNADSPFQVNSQLLVSKELKIYGSRSCGRKDLQEVIDLVSTSKIKPFVAECHPLLEANLVLSKLERGQMVGRSVLVP